MTQIVDPTIFQAPASTTPLPLAQASLNAAVARMQNNLASDMKLFYLLAGLIWNNSQGNTPQQMFTYLGTSAASLVTLCNAWVAFVGAYTGTTPQVVPSGYTLTTNSDGTVTVTQASTGGQ